MKDIEKLFQEFMDSLKKIEDHKTNIPNRPEPLLNEVINDKRAEAVQQWKNALRRLEKRSYSKWLAIQLLITGKASDPLEAQLMVNESTEDKLMMPLRQLESSQSMTSAMALSSATLQSQLYQALVGGQSAMFNQPTLQPNITGTLQGSIVQAMKNNLKGKK